MLRLLNRLLKPFNLEIVICRNKHDSEIIGYGLVSSSGLERVPERHEVETGM